MQKENDLQYLINLKERKEEETKREWQVRSIHTSMSKINRI